LTSIGNQIDQRLQPAVRAAAEARDAVQAAAKEMRGLREALTQVAASVRLEDVGNMVRQIDAARQELARQQTAFSQDQAKAASVISPLEQLLAQYSARLTVAANGIAEKDRQNAALLTELRDQLRLRTTELAAAGQARDAAVAAQHQTEAEAERWRQAAAAADRDRQQAEVKASRAETQARSAQDQVCAAEETKVAAQRDIEVLRKERDAARQESVAARDRAGRLDQEVTQAKAEQQRLTAECQQTQGRGQSLQAELAAAKAGLQATTEQLAAAQKTLEASRAQAYPPPFLTGSLRVWQDELEKHPQQASPQARNLRAALALFAALHASGETGQAVWQSLYEIGRRLAAFLRTREFGPREIRSELEKWAAAFNGLAGGRFSLGVPSIGQQVDLGSMIPSSSGASPPAQVSEVLSWHVRGDKGIVFKADIR
jgi:chemotaxis protein MotB